MTEAGRRGRVRMGRKLLLAVVPLLIVAGTVILTSRDRHDAADQVTASGPLACASDDIFRLRTVPAGWPVSLNGAWIQDASSLGLDMTATSYRVIGPDDQTYMDVAPPSDPGNGVQASDPGRVDEGALRASGDALVVDVRSPSDGCVTRLRIAGTETPTAVQLANSVYYVGSAGE